MNGSLKAVMAVAGGMAGMVILGGCTSQVESTAALATAPSPSVTEIQKPVRVDPTGAVQGFMTTEQRYTRGLQLYDEGAYEEAEREFSAVCEKWSKFSKPFKHLARTQIKLGRFEEALENALDAQEMNSKDGAIDNVVGLAYMELDDFDSAEAAFRSAIEKTPTFAWSYNNLGYLLIQKGDFAGARDILTEGGKQDKAPAILFNNLGMALEKTGDTAGAKDAYAKAVDLDPTHAKATLNLSRLGKPAETLKSEEMVQITEKQ